MNKGHVGSGSLGQRCVNKDMAMDGSERGV